MGNQLSSTNIYFIIPMQDFFKKELGEIIPIFTIQI